MKKIFEDDEPLPLPNMSAHNERWPFPSVSAHHVRRVVDGEEYLTLSGEQWLISSYLEKFGCVPVLCGMPQRRKLGRFTDQREWILCEPDGTTGLEVPPVSVSRDEVFRVLTGCNWFHVGYLMSALVEFDFGQNGEGFSRYAVWGSDTVAPQVEDYYWNYLIEGETLAVRWEDDSETNISFSLKRQLHVGCSRNSLTFYEMSLEVSSPLFPPQALFAQHLLKEYWGTMKQRTE